MARKEKLKSIASRPSTYMKYGDYNKKDVHEGTASYGGNNYTDSPMTNRHQFAVAVKRGHRKNAFIFQNNLYQINDAGGTDYSQVKI
jgi:hypothetical protein